MVSVWNLGVKLGVSARFVSGLGGTPSRQLPPAKPPERTGQNSQNSQGDIKAALSELQVGLFFWEIIKAWYKQLDTKTY